MRKIYFFVAILLLVHLFILSRLQFTAWPEMVSFPYLINHGFVTYTDMIHAYPPLLISVLATLYKVFGYKIIVLKMFGWFGFLVSDVLIFVLVKKLTKKWNIALVGVFMYVILQSTLEGNMVWPDLFIIPFLLAGLLFLFNKKYLFSGILFALALLTKQTAIFFIGCSLLYIVFSEKNFRKLLNFSIGGLIIGVPFLASLVFQKSLVEFINWTIIYPSRYWTKFPGYVQLSPTLRENLILLVFFLPFVFLILKFGKKIAGDKSFLLLFGFFLCGIVGIYPRFSFFHMQSAIVFLVIGCCYLAKNLRKEFIYFLLLIPIFVLIINFRSLHFGGNRFWEQSDLNLGMVIQESTPKDKPIYLLGLNSNLYAFSQRLPNKAWLDNFGWYLEIPGVQEKVIKSFERDMPFKIFWKTPDSGNWYDIGIYQPKMITNWIEKNYTRDREIQKGIWEWRKK